MAAGDRKRTMTMSLVVEDKPARESLNRIDKSTGKTADQFGKAGKAIKLAMTTVALGAVVKFGAQLANRAGEMEGILRRVGQVFGENAKDIETWANESSAKFGESVVTLQGMAAEIGDLLIPMGFSRDVAAEMSIETLNAANALSEWTGGKVTVEEAAGAMTKAFLGEREELKKLGISINEADVKTALMAKGQLGLEGDALKAAKAIATQRLIFEKSADALDAYAKGGDSVIRSQKDLKAAVDNAVDALALKLIPVFEKAFDAAKDFGEGAAVIVDWLNSLPGPVKNAILAIAGIGVALKLLYANPAIAGLALLAGAIIKIGDSARNQKKAVDDMKVALEEAGGSAGDAAVAFLEARDGSGELALIAAELGLTLDDVAKAASGDEDAMRDLKTAFELAKKEGRLTWDQMGLLVSEMKNVEEAAPKAKRELELLADANRIAALETANNRESVGFYADEIRDRVLPELDALIDRTVDLADEQRKAIDPVFALQSANTKYVDALDKVERLQDEGKRGTAEYRDAISDLIKAQADLNFRTAAYEKAGQPALDMLIMLAKEAGLTDDEIQQLIRSFTNLGNLPVLTGATGGIRTITGDPLVPFASGGRVPGPVGAPVPALLHGGEVVLTPRQQAMMGSGLVVNVNAGTIVTENQLNDLIQDVLARYGSRNGVR